MKAIVNQVYGDVDALEFGDVDRPEPGEGEVLVRVVAASVNPYDGHFLSGTPYLVRTTAGIRRPKQPTRGADVAGIVEATGPAVERLAVGDRVFGLARGSFAEYAVARERNLAVVPESLDLAESAAIPMAGVTALQAVRDHAAVEPGRRVLVNGAAGGVGTCAVQIAVAMGAEVTGVCSTHNVDLVRSLGASRVVDYTRDEVVDGTEYNAIIDNVGNRSPGEFRRLLTPSGVYVMVSGPKSNPWLDPFRHMIAMWLRFRFDSRRFANVLASEDTAELEQLVAMMVDGRLAPVIDRRYPLADTAEAMRYVGTGHARAKVLIDVAER